MKKELKKHLTAFLIFTLVTVVSFLTVSRYVDISVLPQISDEATQNTEEIFTPDTSEDSDEAINVPESTETEDTDTSSDTETDSDLTTDTDDGFILKETTDGGTAYLEKLIFLGDKNTYTMGHYVYTGIPAPIRQVWSVEYNVSPSKITNVSNFINPSNQEPTNYISAIKEHTPPFLVLSFGSFDNDEEMTKDKLISELGDFIVKVKTTSPNTQIIVQSIFPVTENCEIITPAEVSERNEWLKELCRVFSLCYLDTHSALCDENGLLLPEFAAADGYLLNENGYRQVVLYVRNHVHPNY